MGWKHYRDGTLVERGDDETRAVYDGAGAKIRDYTEDENAAADVAVAAAAEQQVEVTLAEQVRTEIQAIRDAIGPGDAPVGTDR